MRTVLSFKLNTQSIFHVNYRCGLKTKRAKDTGEKATICEAPPDPGLFYSPCCPAFGSFGAASSCFWLCWVHLCFSCLCSHYTSASPTGPYTVLLLTILFATPWQLLWLIHWLFCDSGQRGTSHHARRARESSSVATDTGMAGAYSPMHCGGEGWARVPELWAKVPESQLSLFSSGLRSETSNMG